VWRLGGLHLRQRETGHTNTRQEQHHKRPHKEDSRCRRKLSGTTGQTEWDDRTSSSGNAKTAGVVCGSMGLVQPNYRVCSSRHGTGQSSVREFATVAYARSGLIRGAWAACTCVTRETGHTHKRTTKTKSHRHRRPHTHTHTNTERPTATAQRPLNSRSRRRRPQKSKEKQVTETRKQSHNTGAHAKNTLHK